MAVFALISHWMRALRWKLLIEQTGNQVKNWTSFHSLMVGYLVNLAIPRGGEVSRTYNLYKLEKTPIETSFGTVVVERIIDVLCLFILMAICFLVQWNALVTFFNSLGIGNSSEGISIPLWLWIVLGLGFIFLLVLYLFRKNEKLLKILIGFKSGLLSVLHLKKKRLFLIQTAIIWVLYFLMTYSVMLAFEKTAALGIGGVLVIFVIGGIAMAIPLPGGLGSYHTLLPLGLVMIYNMDRTDATAFVFIFHAWQTLVMIVGGVVSLICTSVLLKTKKT